MENIEDNEVESLNSSHDESARKKSKMSLEFPTDMHESRVHLDLPDAVFKSICLIIFRYFLNPLIKCCFRRWFNNC